MLYSNRNINIDTDRETLLELHFSANYESGTPSFRAIPFDVAKAWWFASSQVNEFLSALAESLKDDRTIAQIWEDGASVVGFVWVRFTDIKGYNLVFAEIDDIAVMPAYQRQGVGKMIMAHVEQLARERGAHILRSGTGIENSASQGLHQKMSFQTIHVKYEKFLYSGDTLWKRMNRIDQG